MPRRTSTLHVCAAAFALLAAAPGVAPAQPAQASCAAQDAALPPALAAWTAKTDVVSATAAAGLPAATIRVGQAVRITLHPAPQVSYPLAPAKPAGPGLSGGLLRFQVDRAGTYRVALGAGAWIDVVRDGKAVDSAAHGHGPACSTIRKMVDFPLQPGAYVLQLSGAGEPQTTVLVTPAAP